MTFRTDGRAPRDRSPRRLRPRRGRRHSSEDAQLDEALAAGAQFVVSPALDAAVVERCLARGRAVVPGIGTATELKQALALGLGRRKLFPAEPLGGAALIAALAAPFPEARFVPTGGLGMQNAAGYLRLPFGSSPSEAAGWSRLSSAAPDWETVTRLTAEAIALAASRVKYDVVALGEVILGSTRRRPHSKRPDFRVWEGGGEYNVARGLRRCFGLARRS